jgi:hypothetical protein
MDTDFPTDAMILYTELKVMTEDGNRIDIAKGLYNHHAVFFSTSKTKVGDILSCNGRPMRIPTVPTFMGSAAEELQDYFADPKSKIDTGFYLPKGDKILAQIDIVNYKDYDQNVWLVPEIEYIPGKPPGYLDSEKYTLSPNTCDSPLGAMAGGFIKPPPGAKKWAINGTDMTFTKDGYIVFSRKFDIAARK